MSTYVLVHGAYHGGWCWYKVVPELESRGHRAITVELPAHGIDTTPADEVTMDGYVDRVCDAIDAAEEEVVLVGHSMAGMVITQASERRPDAVGTLVYLTAYLPADGESMLDQRVPGTPIAEHFSVDEDRGVGVVERDALEELFYADCSRADLTLGRSLFRDEPMGPLSASMDLSEEAFGSVRRAYVSCEEDRVIMPEQQREARERGVASHVSLPSSHSAFLSMPERTVDAFETVTE